MLLDSMFVKYHVFMNIMWLSISVKCYVGIQYLKLTLTWMLELEWSVFA